MSEKKISLAQGKSLSSQAADEPKELGGHTLSWYEAILSAKSHFPSRE
ncbi:MAG: hypothetical protein ABI758_01070 [Candidatus Woesebacteria bacterium]